MASETEEAGMAEKSRGGPPERLALNDLAGTRKSFARIIRAFNNGALDESKTRTLAYLFNTLSSLFKAEIEADFERRLEELEKSLRVRI